MKLLALIFALAALSPYAHSSPVSVTINFFQCTGGWKINPVTGAGTCQGVYALGTISNGVNEENIVAQILHGETTDQDMDVAQTFCKKQGYSSAKSVDYPTNDSFPGGNFFILFNKDLSVAKILDRFPEHASYFHAITCNL